MNDLDNMSPKRVAIPLDTPETKHLPRKYQARTARNAWHVLLFSIGSLAQINSKQALQLANRAYILPKKTSMEKHIHAAPKKRAPKKEKHIKEKNGPALLFSTARCCFSYGEVFGADSLLPSPPPGSGKARFATRIGTDMT